MSDEKDGNPVAQIAAHLWRYAQDQELLRGASDDVQAYLTELAQEASITVHAINGRPKSLSSYEKKASKIDSSGGPRYPDPATQIHDCVAARVILFTTSARDDLVLLVKSRTDVLEHKNPGLTKYNGYDSEHLVINGLTDEDAQARYPRLTRYLKEYPGLEIQLRSVASHAWAEYEHDIRYKAGAYQGLSADGKLQIDQWFVEAGGMRRVMDNLFAQIEGTLISKDTKEEAAPASPEEVEAAPEETDETPIGQASLARVVAARHPGAERGEGRDYDVVLEQLDRLGIKTVGQLEVALADLEEGYVAQLMDYPTSTSGVRRLDDEILAAFTDRYVEVAPDGKRKQLLELRLRRVRGKFAIYSIEVGETATPPMTAARTVRHLAAIVADASGLEAAEVLGAISRVEGDLNASAHARLVRTTSGSLSVASNLTRAWAEEIMRALVKGAPSAGIRIVRAGDTFLQSEDDTL